MKAQTRRPQRMRRQRDRRAFHRRPRIVSLFSGYGGLEMGVQSVIGGDVVAHVEFDEAPSRILAHHWPNVPNLGDITAVDWSAFLAAHPELGGLVDGCRPWLVVVGGFPCQDVSQAGRRQGLRDGTRSGLWSEFARAIATLRPGLVVIENVRGLLSADGEPWHDELLEAQAAVNRWAAALALAADFTERNTTHVAQWRRARVRATRSLKRAMARLARERRLVRRAIDTVLRDLADLGYDASWSCIRASDAGATHARERIFVVAHPAGQRWGAGRPALDATRRQPHGDDTHRRAADVADADEFGREGRVVGRRRVGEPAGRATATASDSDGGDRHGRQPSPRRGSVRRAAAARGARRVPAAVDARRARLREQPGGAPAEEARSYEGHEPQGDARPRPVADWGPYRSTVERWESVIGRPAPVPHEPAVKGGAPRGSRWFGEWMMGLPQGHVCAPEIGLNYTESWKAIGNGVVPQQAALGTLIGLQRMELAA